ncbi:MAG: biosynthetic-type acetolactate synthase large subunit [Clostridia bacterium]|nr:biosynthetic-type acetolactate synthase large subunit [Clostridia bacterium]
MLLTGAEIVIETLAEQGVDVVFGYPGGSVLEIYDALYKSDKVRHILTAHEQGAAHAAEGYSRASGKVGVALATSGPGATNLVTGIASAFMDSIPVVFLTGNVPTSVIGKDSFQEIYIAGITMPITKHNFIVRKIEDLADTIRNAFTIAMSGRPGPVLVDIPRDISQATTEYIPEHARTPKPLPRIFRDDLRLAAQAIYEAKRPMLFLGGGVVSSNAAAVVKKFIKRTDMPVCHSLMATGILKTNDPYNMGMVGMHGSATSAHAVQKCDLLVTLGSRFSDRVATNARQFAPNATIIHIDIDAAEIDKTIHAGIGLVGDIKSVLTALLPLIEQKDCSDWRNELTEYKNSNEYRPAENKNVLVPKTIIETLWKKFSKEAIMTTDVGQHQMWAAQYCNSGRSRSFLTSGGLGAMGFGYGASIGASFACPDRRIIHITGDGSFHMNIAEICTAVTYSLPIITVVLNNEALGMVRQLQHVAMGDRFSTTIHGRKTDFAAVARGFGAQGFTCRTQKEFLKALEAAKQTLDRPTVIDCTIAQELLVLPMIPSGKSAADIITE